MEDVRVAKDDALDVLLHAQRHANDHQVEQVGIEHTVPLGSRDAANAAELLGPQANGIARASERLEDPEGLLVDADRFFGDFSIL